MQAGLLGSGQPDGAPVLLDLVLQDGHLGPARDGMGGDPSAKADAVLGHTKSVAPERVTLGKGTAENSVLGNALSFTLYHAALCHAYDLFSLNHANRLRIILVINSSMIRAIDHALETAPSPVSPSSLSIIAGPEIFHDLCRRQAGFQSVGHEPHGRAGMGEKRLVSLT